MHRPAQERLNHGAGERLANWLLRQEYAEHAAILRRRMMIWKEPATGITFVWVPPGEFWMGSSKTQGEPNHDNHASNDELPAHCVRFTRGLWIGQHPVTNEDYGRFLEATGHRHPAYWRNACFNKAGQPVTGVDHADALAFCTWATTAAGLPGENGDSISLPSEAEWEYVARAAGENNGVARRYPWGNEPPDAQRAVFGRGADGAPAVVGGRPAGATPLGVHDLTGNVWEWCLDAYAPYPELTVRVDPPPAASPDGGAPRVVRGGSWSNLPAWNLRAADRYGLSPRYQSDLVGFRVVCRSVLGLMRRQS